MLLRGAGTPVGYSYTKRFTWLSHLVLGVVIGLPSRVWVAVTGTCQAASRSIPGARDLYRGFDILYACQDVEFDRKEGLYSCPCGSG